MSIIIGKNEKATLTAANQVELPFVMNMYVPPIKMVAEVAYNKVNRGLFQPFLSILGEELSVGSIPLSFSNPKLDGTIKPTDFITNLNFKVYYIIEDTILKGKKFSHIKDFQEDLPKTMAAFHKINKASFKDSSHNFITIKAPVITNNLNEVACNIPVAMDIELAKGMIFIRSYVAVNVIIETKTPQLNDKVRKVWAKAISEEV